MNYKKLIPVMLCFFAMGFVDMVGIASNYVKEDLGLSDSMANILPSLVFLWFLIFSIPTSLLMNKIGRKNTVLLSLVLTLAAMIVPVFTLDFTMPSASTLTFGQFIKSIASFLAPIIASWGATTNAFGFGWRAIYPIYLGVGILTTLLLFGTKIKDQSQTLSDSSVKAEERSVGAQFAGAFGLLSNPFILLCFLAIICHVGIDVGTSVTAPKILMERAGIGLNEAAIIGTIYFVAKAAGSFSGSFIMNYVKEWTFLLLSVLMMVVSAFGLVFGESAIVIYVSVALMGFGNGNPFSIVFARALQAVPDKKNEVSGLLIMGIFGGAIFPFLMGFASDAFGQIGAVAVMSLGIIYLLAFYFQGRKPSAA